VVLKKLLYGCCRLQNTIHLRKSYFIFIIWYHHYNSNLIYLDPSTSALSSYNKRRTNRRRLDLTNASCHSEHHGQPSLAIAIKRQRRTADRSTVDS
jgi:hypothetical protein